MDNNKRKIYLDYAATTPVDEAVFEAMKPYFCEKYGNASSAHFFGREARRAVEDSRQQVANFLGCEPKEIIFTSCATESNNLALKGVVKAVNRKQLTANKKVHIITSSIEHHCVLHTCESLEKDGLAEITYLPVNQEGIVEVESVEKAIKDNTILVSVMYANNEIGAIQPIQEIGKVIKKINESKVQNLISKIYFHVDAVQAINYLDCSVEKLGVDLLSLSAHKFYGPKGVGALYIKKGTPIARIQDGGEQEFKLRAGTLNVPGIVGLGHAISQLTDNSKQETAEKILKLKNKLVDEVLKSVPNAKLNGAREKRLPNNANFSFPGAEGEAILLALDMEGVAVSTGSACASENLNPSHVLIALGLGPEDSHSSIRMTLGKYTTKSDVDYVLEILPRVVERLRKISGSGQNKGEAKKKLPDDFGC
jgi:cysteine desulfurase